MSTTGTGQQKETVYQGPAPGETVFDETKFVAKKADTSVARNAVTKTIRWASLRFFGVAAVSLVQFFLFQEEDPILSVFALIVAIVFAVIGFYAFKMSRMAFLIALGLYGLNFLALLGAALMEPGGIFVYIKSLFVNGSILAALYRYYGTLTDLHLLEND